MRHSCAVSIRYPDFDLPTQGDTKNAVKFSEEMFNYMAMIIVL
ncbi:MAG: hypothetical protein ACTSVZ_04910 [Promethearchaeota archaeon]